MTYAARTRVSGDRTSSTIRGLLLKAGATRFGIVETGGTEASIDIAFELHDRRIRFHVPLPDRAEFALTPSGKWRRAEAEATRLHQQAVAARWRAIHLFIRSKLEAVDVGLVTFDEAFLSDIVLQDGATLLEHVRERPAVWEPLQLTGAPS